MSKVAGLGSALPARGGKPLGPPKTSGEAGPAVEKRRSSRRLSGVAVGGDDPAEKENKRAAKRQRSSAAASPAAAEAAAAGDGGWQRDKRQPVTATETAKHARAQVSKEAKRALTHGVRRPAEEYEAAAPSGRVRPCK